MDERPQGSDATEPSSAGISDDPREGRIGPDPLIDRPGQGGMEQERRSRPRKAVERRARVVP